MGHLWDIFDKRSGRKWRSLFKALSLLDFLMKNGASRLADEVRDNQFKIRQLQQFEHIEDGKDRGQGVRDMARILLELCSDLRLLEEEREKARLVRERAEGIARTTMHSGGAFGGGGEFRGGDFSSGNGTAGRSGGGASKSDGFSAEDYARKQAFEKKKEQHDQFREEHVDGTGSGTLRRPGGGKIQVKSTRARKGEVNSGGGGGTKAEGGGAVDLLDLDGGGPSGGNADEWGNFESTGGGDDFGAFAAVPETGGGFGAPAAGGQKKSDMDDLLGGDFGGAPAAQSGGFGAQPSGFGAQPSGFGAAPAQQENQFGSFGGGQQNSFGNQQSGGFGAPAGPQQSGFGSFGGAPQQQSFGVPQQQNFGAPQQQNFGAPQQQNFGVPQQQNFGAPQQQNFGAPQQQNQFGSFGPAQPQQNSQFGGFNNANNANGFGTFGSSNGPAGGPPPTFGAPQTNFNNNNAFNTNNAASANKNDDLLNLLGPGGAAPGAAGGGPAPGAPGGGPGAPGGGPGGPTASISMDLMAGATLEQPKQEQKKKDPLLDLVDFDMPGDGFSLK